MFEYGAPLVDSWAKQEGNDVLFQQAIRQFPNLLVWVVHVKKMSKSKVSLNLCGLTSLKARFAHLRTAYQWVLEQSGLGNPLRKVLDKQTPTVDGSSRFLQNLRNDRGWADFKQAGDFHPTAPVALRRYLMKRQTDIVLADASNTHLTTIIPKERR